MPATKAPRKRKSRGPAATKGSKKVNVSAAVRKMLRKDSSAKPKQISLALAKRGVTVKPTYVSIIKSKFLAGAGNSKGAAGKTRSTAERFELGDLMEAKKFARQIGGVDRAKEVINAIAKLQ